jgi:23S rRNA pseudouridine1911/1915/1917 synthase
VPVDWQRTSRNLQAAIESSIRAHDFWARCRNLKFLRYVHRLDAETSGVLLLAKSPGALQAFTRLFQSRHIEKVYLAVVRGAPRELAWVSRQRIGPDPAQRGRMKIDPRQGQEAETRFRVLATRDNAALVEARPLTGRTHQIRVHLAASKLPVLGDQLYGGPSSPQPEFPLALRAASLAYTDPFRRKPVVIEAAADAFLKAYGFGGDNAGSTPPGPTQLP